MTKPNIPRPPIPGAGGPTPAPRKASPPLHGALPGLNPPPPPPARPPAPPTAARPKPPPLSALTAQPQAATPPAPAALSDENLIALLGFELLERLSARGATLRFRVRTPEGAERLLARVNQTAAPLEHELFLAGARVMRELGDRPDILKVYAVYEEHQAFLSDLWTVGNTSDLSALRWTLEQKLDYIFAIGQTLQALHELGLIHGCLCPSNVLLNDDLRPVLTEAGTVSIADHMNKLDELDNEYKAYAAPEVLKGIVLEGSVDVYSLAQLAHFVILEQTPKADPSPLQGLEELAKVAPDGIVRVIRRATAKAKAARYRTIAAFLKELRDYKHPEVGLARDGKPGLGVTAPPKQSPPTAKRSEARARPLAASTRASSQAPWRKWWLLALAVGVLVAIALAFFLRK